MPGCCKAEYETGRHLVLLIFWDTYFAFILSITKNLFQTLKIKPSIVWTRLATMGTRQYAPTKWWRQYGSPVRTNYIQSFAFLKPHSSIHLELHLAAAFILLRHFWQCWMNNVFVLVSIRIQWLLKSVYFVLKQCAKRPPFCKIILDVRWRIHHTTVSSGGCQLHRQDSWRRRGTDSCCLPTPQSLFNNGLEIGRNQPRRACQQPPQ